jgi:hypothetical protein
MGLSGLLPEGRVHCGEEVVVGLDLVFGPPRRGLCLCLVDFRLGQLIRKRLALLSDVGIAFLQQSV